MTRTTDNPTGTTVTPHSDPNARQRVARDREGGLWIIRDSSTGSRYRVTGFPEEGEMVMPVDTSNGWMRFDPLGPDERLKRDLREKIAVFDSRAKLDTAPPEARDAARVCAEYFRGALRALQDFG